MGVSTACNVQDANNIFPTTSLSGSVGDGPVTLAQVTVTDASGSVAGVSVSDNTANYNVEVLANATYPLLLKVSGGTDVVTGTEPDFNMLSVATDSSVGTVNINPFSTVIVKIAQAMPGGLTSVNLSTANRYVQQNFNFGLDPTLVPNPITTPIDANNVAVMVKASEALGETIRRAQSALLSAGVDLTSNAIIDLVAGDMSDGVLDGQGSNANAQVAAVTNVVSAQVLVESAANKIHVGGSDATSLLDSAITLTAPDATMSSADVVVTDAMLSQAKTVLAATLAFNTSTDLSSMLSALSTHSGSASSAEIVSALPANFLSAFDSAVSQVATASNSQLEVINAAVRTANPGAGGSDTGNTDGGNTGGGNTGGGNTGGGSTDNGGNTDTGGSTGGDTGGTITPADTTSPVITLLGENPVSLTVGSSYVDAGANAMDDVDGDISAAINVDNSGVNTSVAGTYSVVYNVSDAAGNAATSVTRTVTVVNPAGASSYEDLLNDMNGFAKKAGTTGGKGGAICWVTTLNDSGTGSLRDCAGSSGAKWIRFKVAGTIKTSSPLFLTSNKTIDGRDQKVVISGYGLRLHGISNVVIHDIEMKGGVGSIGDNSLNNDAIQIWKGSSKVWVDHVSASGWPDELLDISHASTDITVSWNRFFDAGNTGRNYGILIGSAPSHTGDVAIRVTLHHNFFEKLDQRIPRIRFAKVHSYNNYFYDWKSYATWASQLSQVYSESNIYESVRTTDALKATAAGTDTSPGEAKDVGSWKLNGAKVVERNPQNVFLPSSLYSYQAETADATLRTRITSGAGVY